jgi:hypothetical protein
MRKLEELDIECDTGFSGARYAFDPSAWIRAFGEFNSLLYSQIDTGQFAHVLQFDLSNFYDSIRLDILERWIREESPSDKGWVIALLFYFLNQWNRRNTGLHPQAVGIPQDALADCSRILANYYLQKYDRFAAIICKRANALYFRYADDQMILLKNAESVESLMLLLTRNLDRYGLRVNQRKIDVWKIKDLEKYRCRMLHAIFAKEGDSKNPTPVRKFAGAYLAMPKEKLKNPWNGGLPLLNRLLWSNLESLPKNVFNKLIVRYLEDEYLRRADHQKLARVYELNAKRKKPADLPDRIRRLATECIHSGFLYEALSFARSLKNASLARHLRKRLNTIQKQLAEHDVT